MRSIKFWVHSGFRVRQGHKNNRITRLPKLDELQEEELEGFKIYTRGYLVGCGGHSKVKGRSFRVKGGVKQGDENQC